jgi:uncharacterized protein YabE (DUF348 family)
LFLLIGLVVLFGAIIVTGLYILTAKSVIVTINGIPHEIRTHSGTVDAVLREVGYPIETADQVTPDATTAIYSGLKITMVKAAVVNIWVEGQAQQFHTLLTDPLAILSAAHVTVGQHDQILVDGHALTPQAHTPPGRIEVQRAITLHIKVEGTTTDLQTVHHQVGDVLAEAKIDLYLADVITPGLGSMLKDGDTIQVQRAIPVTIKVDGLVLMTRTHGATVDAVLGEAGIALVGMDTSTPSGTTPTTPNMTIKVTRVTDDDEVEREDIDFNVVTQTDPKLPLDTQKVIQPGVKGIRETRYHVRREDGAVVSRSAPVTVVVQPPQDQIVAVGTAAVLKTLDTPDGGTIQYWRVLTVTAHSYKPASTGKDASDPTYGITATGDKLHKGIVAVDPSVIPLGTKLYIPGYGLAVAADTGGAVQGLIVDLGYTDADYQEWSRPVQVYLLAPIPSLIPSLPATAITPDTNGVSK